MCVGFFLVIPTTTAVIVALTRIQAAFGSAGTGLQWVVDGYSLVFASLLLTDGARRDCLGYKRVFGAGVAGGRSSNASSRSVGSWAYWMTREDNTATRWL